MMRKKKRRDMKKNQTGIQGIQPRIHLFLAVFSMAGYAQDVKDPWSHDYELEQQEGLSVRRKLQHDQTSPFLLQSCDRRS